MDFKNYITKFKNISMDRIQILDENNYTISGNKYSLYDEKIFRNNLMPMVTSIIKKNKSYDSIQKRKSTAGLTAFAYFMSYINMCPDETDNLDKILFDGSNVSSIEKKNFYMILTTQTPFPSVVNQYGDINDVINKLPKELKVPSVIFGLCKQTLLDEIENCQIECAKESLNLFETFGYCEEMINADDLKYSSSIGLMRAVSKGDKEFPEKLDELLYELNPDFDIKSSMAIAIAFALQTEKINYASSLKKLTNIDEVLSYFKPKSEFIIVGEELGEADTIIDGIKPINEEAVYWMEDNNIEPKKSYQDITEFKNKACFLEVTNKGNYMFDEILRLYESIFNFEKSMTEQEYAQLTSVNPKNEIAI